jgi:DNA modification methylase
MSPGSSWFPTSTTVWKLDELPRSRLKQWRQLTNETGHTGSRAGAMRADHYSVFTGTHSIFACPLAEWILRRYGGPPGGYVLDAFAGGPPRALVAAVMGFHYVGFEIREEQIQENEDVLHELGLLKNVRYIHGDGRFLDGDLPMFDAAVTCPPYYDVERYSDLPSDLSNLATYAEFNAGIWFSALAHRKRMKPGSFVCIVVGNFRSASTGELIDFRSDTVQNFRDAGFKFHDEIIVVKNAGSAARRAANAWRTMKLVRQHEFVLVFKTPP